MEGRHGLLGIFGCCIVLWLTVNQAQSAGIPQRVNAGEKPSTSFMSSIPALNVLSMMAKSHGNGWKTPQEINQTCPRLWSPTNEDFKRDKLTGVLGSLEEMSHLCNSDSKTAPLSAVCLGAVGISNYLCDIMSKRPGISNSSQPLKPIDDETLKLISSVDGLCQMLGDEGFQSTLCNFIMKNQNAQLFKPLMPEGCMNSLPNNKFQFQCQNWCGSDQRGCQMILQSLRTIIHWEEMKTENSMEDGAPANGIADPDAEGGDALPEKLDTKEMTQPALPTNKTEAPSGQKDAGSNSTSETKPSAPTTVAPKMNSTSTESGSSTKAGQHVTKSANVTSSSIGKTTTTVAASPIGDEEKTDSPLLDLDAEENLGDLGMEEPPRNTEELSKGDQDLLGDDEDDGEKEMDAAPEETVKTPDQSNKPKLDFHSDIDDDPVNTHFLFYFLAFVVLSVIGYVVYQRRGRIIALVVEGRPGSSSGRRRSSSTRGERPSAGGYRKLVNNLEEAISSHSVKKSNVIY